MPGPDFDSCTTPHRGSLGSAGAAWTDAAIALGANTNAAVVAGAALEACYAQTHRHYHDLRHVRAVLRDTELLAVEFGLDPDDRCILTLAVCAHDVVYDAKPGEDERSSAAWAHSRLSGAGVTGTVADRVAELVLTTIEHEAPATDTVADALLDADLAILGAPAAVYSAYVADVRDEYAQVSEPDWRIGRAAVVSRLLARRDLYRSAPARRRWNALARTNLTAELAQLEVT